MHIFYSVFSTITIHSDAARSQYNALFTSSEEQATTYERAI
ncbi:hypothetical protein [Robertmurraya korlensis]|nr:hypothetical protein [Robertmurraya korlensis]